MSLAFNMHTHTNSGGMASQHFQGQLQRSRLRLAQLAGHIARDLAGSSGRSGSSGCSGSSGRSSSSSAQEGSRPVGIADSPDGIPLLDYGRSYGRPYNNSRDSVRVLVEGRSVIYDDIAGGATVYYLLASCKSEDTYGLKKAYGEAGFEPGANTLFSNPNYDFSWIIGGG